MKKLVSLILTVVMVLSASSVLAIDQHEPEFYEQQVQLLVDTLQSYYEENYGEGALVAPYEEPVEVTIVNYYSSTLETNMATWNEWWGETLENNRYVDAIERALNIKIKFAWLKNNADNGYVTQLRLAIASGEIPDMFLVTNQNDLIQLAESGLIMPVSDVIESSFVTKDKEIMINFTREQWDRHTEIFQRELGYVAAEENPNVMAIVFRSGLITMRVAMVLCGYRIMEAGWDVNEYTCSDEDFDSAMKIVLTCMTHSINLSTIIGETIKRQRLTNYYKLLPALKAMKKEFRYTDFLNEVRKLGFGDSAAKRALKKHLKSGLISRTSDGYRKNKI